MDECFHITDSYESLGRVVKPSVMLAHEIDAAELGARVQTAQVYTSFSDDRLAREVASLLRLPSGVAERTRTVRHGENIIVVARKDWADAPHGLAFSHFEVAV